MYFKVGQASRTREIYYNFSGLLYIIGKKNAHARTSLF